MYHSSLELTIHNIYTVTRAQSDGWSQSHRETRRHIHPETCSNVSSGFSKNGTSFGRPNSKILMFMQYYYVSRNYIKSKTNQLPISVTGDSCPRTTDSQQVWPIWADQLDKFIESIFGSTYTILTSSCVRIPSYSPSVYRLQVLQRQITRHDVINAYS